MKNKQTAVEWLKQQINTLENHNVKELISLFNKAIAMEKEQTMTFAKLWEEKLLDGRIDSVDDLYNETYKQ
jgi:hypothetical protein